VLESVRISGMVIFLVASAVVFGDFLSLTRTPFELAAWVEGLPVAPIVILAVVIIIYLLGGAFMDALGFLVISIPLFFPLISALGYDIVWFTILITLITTIGSVTPPVGINVFITSGVSKKWRSEERRVGNVTGVQTCALPIWSVSLSTCSVEHSWTLLAS